MAEKVTIGNCELWHGDSLEVLPFVFADCVITDPPYGVNLGEAGETALGKTAYIGFVDDVDYVRKVCVPIILICIEKFSRVVLTPGNRNCFEYPKPDEIGAIYNAAGAGFCRWGTNTSQPILYYGKDPHNKKKKPQAIQWNEISENNGHPCPKPIRLMNWFVDRASLTGETVCDPFMGSGTTGVACVNLGRKFVGIERERKYFDIAVRRIEQAYAQPGCSRTQKSAIRRCRATCFCLLTRCNFSGYELKTIAGTLAAPFPYFGGKSNACELVWSLLGQPDNYVEPFAGSAAMILGRPDGGGVETINDFDGFVANFWRAISKDPSLVAFHADWPVNEADLLARHSWLVRQTELLREALHDPDFYDAKIAGWWCWGACNWIGSGWCSGSGPWVWDGEKIVDSRKLPHLGDAGQGINRKLPHLGNAGQGINRKLPHLGNAGRGINRQLPHLSAGRGEYIAEWFNLLYARLRDVRVTCGDWKRVCKDSVTTRHGLTGIFLDPPYDKGEMDYGAGGMGLGISAQVREWCAANGDNKQLRIVICGHAGEHDDLLKLGWKLHNWTARKGYALTDEAKENSSSETVWASPHCLSATNTQDALF